MTHVIVKVGDTHHGKLVPGMLIVVPVEKISEQDSNGMLYFVNPIDGGYSYGKLMLHLTKEESVALSDEPEQETSWERHSPINFDR